MKANPIDIVRRSGLMPVVRPAAEKLAGFFGQTLVATQHVGTRTWLGLPSYPIRTILDIGACDGRFALDVLLKHFPTAKVHSFEPSPVTFEHLEKVAANSHGRIVAHRFGLGERSEKMPFHYAADLVAASSLLAPTQRQHQHFSETKRSQKQTVEIRVLDEVAPDLAIDQEVLVKIDVQGFEDRVIRGGKKTIATARACVIEIQVEDLYEGQPSFKDIYSLMDGLDFDFQGVLDQYSDAGGRVLYFDALFIRK